MLQFIFQNDNQLIGVRSGGTGSVIPYVIAAIVLFAVIVYAVHRLFRFLRRPDLHEMERQKIAETWTEIEKTSGAGIMGAKIAVIEADKLLDAALKSMLMPGDTLGERLKAAAYKYPDIRKAWWAHKLRNQLVHDSAFQITTGQARSALRDYHAALRVLNVMD